ITGRQGVCKPEGGHAGRPPAPVHSAERSRPADGEPERPVADVHRFDLVDGRRDVLEEVVVPAVAGELALHHEWSDVDAAAHPGMYRDVVAQVRRAVRPRVEDPVVPADPADEYTDFPPRGDEVGVDPLTGCTGAD